MKKQGTRIVPRIALTALLAIFLVGCNQSQSPTQPPPPSTFSIGAGDQ